MNKYVKWAISGGIVALLYLMLTFKVGAYYICAMTPHDVWDWCQLNWGFNLNPWLLPVVYSLKGFSNTAIFVSQFLFGAIIGLIIVALRK